MATLGVQHEIN